MSNCSPSGPGCWLIALVRWWLSTGGICSTCAATECFSSVPRVESKVSDSVCQTKCVICQPLPFLALLSLICFLEFCWRVSELVAGCFSHSFGSHCIAVQRQLWHRAFQISRPQHLAFWKNDNSFFCRSVRIWLDNVSWQ